MNSSRVGYGLAAALVTGCLGAGMATAQTFPTKPVRLIVPFAPGGATDIVARLIAPRLGEYLGQTVVVENRGGGAATIGMDLVAKSPPDGHTLGVATLTFALNPALGRRLPYDSEKDFAPVAMVSITPFVILVHPSIPARSVPQLIKLAQARPGSLNFSSSGVASASQMSIELLKYMSKTDMVHIPYTGGGPALVALLSGQVSIFTGSIPAALSYIKAGRLFALGVTSADRDPALPDVPSIAESLPGYELLEYQGIMAPGATPRPVIDRLHAEIVKTLSSPDIKERFTTSGARIVAGSPDDLAKHIRAQVALWRKVTTAAGIKVE